MPKHKAKCITMHGMVVLVLCPPQAKFGFLSNNPPIYDLAPKAREMVPKNLEERGVGRVHP